MWIRDVHDDDLEVFYGHQLDPEAIRMAAFPPRDRDAFMAHWATIRADDTVVLQTVVVDGQVAGNVVSWEQDGRRLVGYWFGRDHWGRGIATRALALFLDRVPLRPLYAQVAVHNAGSIRVLEKCGFRPVPAHEVAHPAGVADDVEEVLFVLEETGSFGN
ncbi:MAG TPA: GNAT family N-acetyltransferase [Actinoplanes sp.]|nr:GNAT family N-acetyltransferase [Actinoplanes sp.]